MIMMIMMMMMVVPVCLRDGGVNIIKGPPSDMDKQYSDALPRYLRRREDTTARRTVRVGKPSKKAEDIRSYFELVAGGYGEDSIVQIVHAQVEVTPIVIETVMRG